MMARRITSRTAAALVALLGATPLAAIAQTTGTTVAASQPAPADALPANFRDRRPEDEIIYFVLPDRFENGDASNDRGGLRGDHLATGFDPTRKGFFLGGDLAGLTRRLDYIKGLGATAIWLGPIYKNKPVQGPPGQESAGYHGYWITDFTRVDPHFGDDKSMRAFVAAAHARGMKVYLDIITNHTADVINFAECAGKSCPYRSRADYPYQRRGGVEGPAINPGFQGDQLRTADNFARLTDPNFAYTVVVPPAERTVKVPAWLNDPIWYHNRGDTTFRNESSRMGDFVGLDDLMTENPRVVQGMIDIFGDWIDRYGIDGFRIDTARHVNPEFWQAFVPAMLARARAKGISNFHIFGEVYEDGVQPGRLAQHTVRDGFPAVLDFAFTAAMRQVVGEGKPTSVLNGLFEQDVLYAGGRPGDLDAGARQLPTFLGNHDMGRFAQAVKAANPRAGDEELTARVELGHMMMLFARGAPTIYYGDEQGFVGDGGDQDARETMFPSRVAVYNDNDLLGTDATTAASNFDTAHPLYKAIAAGAAVRQAHAALRSGRQVMRAYGDTPGLVAWSRFAPDGREYLVVANTAATAVTAQVEVEVASTDWSSLIGQCAQRATAPGSVTVALPAFGYAVCAAR